VTTVSMSPVSATHPQAFSIFSKGGRGGAYKILRREFSHLLEPSLNKPPNSSSFLLPTVWTITESDSSNPSSPLKLIQQLHFL
jgi:hypothetical protein